jgi:hypothetical protein
MDRETMMDTTSSMFLVTRDVFQSPESPPKFFQSQSIMVSSICNIADVLEALEPW